MLYESDGKKKLEPSVAWGQLKDIKIELIDALFYEVNQDLKRRKVTRKDGLGATQAHVSRTLF